MSIIATKGTPGPASSTTGSNPGYAATVLADNPTWYYRLNEGPNASAAVDSGPNALASGSFVATNPVPGKAGVLKGDVGTSYRFANGAVRLPTAALPTAVDNWTMEAWINPNYLPASVNNAFGTVLSIGDGSGGYMMGVGAIPDSSGTGLGILFGGVNWFAGAPAGTFAVNEPAHIVVKREAGTLKSYVNGKQVNGAITNTAPANPQTSAGTYPNPLIGQRAGQTSETFAGLIQEVAFYTSALPDARIAEHFRVGSAAGVAGVNGAPTSVTDLGNMGAAKTFNTGNVIVTAAKGVLNANCALTITNMATPSRSRLFLTNSGSFTLSIAQGSDAQVAIPIPTNADFELELDFDGTDLRVSILGGAPSYVFALGGRLFEDTDGSLKFTNFNGRTTTIATGAA